MKSRLTIQERLWELRKDRGLNLGELAELTGISKSALGSYETEDYKEINHSNLVTLADFYGVSIDYLLCRTENRKLPLNEGIWLISVFSRVDLPMPLNPVITIFSPPFMEKLMSDKTG